MSDVRTNAASGHCYLEFIEKNAITGQLVAKARGSDLGENIPDAETLF